MRFELTPKEQETADGIIQALKLKHGDIGLVTYSFTSGAIGITVEMSLKKLNITKDITDYHSW